MRPIPTATALATGAALKALTIWQPWAECIATGAKTIENRTRPFGHRGPLAIHAGRRHDPWAEHDPLVRATLRGPADALPVGAVIAVAELVDCHPDHGCCRPWGEPGTHHLVLTDIRRLPRPVPARGHLGLWDVTLPDSLNGGGGK